MILGSPVGNPDLWERNRVAVEYNKQVTLENAARRKNPENVDRRGHLKPGRALNDGMDIYRPRGYVGGRFRNSWYVTVGAPSNAGAREPDKSGAGSLSDLKNIGGAGTVTYLCNNMPYGLRLEYGWSKQAPEGMVRINVARIAEKYK